MDQMDDYVNIDAVYPNRDGCRPGKLETDRGMKDRSPHKLSAPIVYSLLGFSILLSTAALSTAVILNLRHCPSAWASFKQSCYLFTSSSQTWEGAKDSCISAQAHLVVINDAEEQDYLRKKNQAPRWIGLRDKASEGDWRWVDGTDYKSSVKFWSKGEPNNANDEDCVELRSDGNWNDLYCNKSLGWICEKLAQ